MPSARELKSDRETKTHTWVIRNLGNHVGQLTSPTFSMFNGNEQKFQFSLKSNRSGRLLILRCMEQVRLPIWCMYKISIQAIGSTYEIGTGHHAFGTFHSEKEIFKFPSDRFDHFQSTLRSIDLPTKDTFAFVCQLVDMMHSSPADANWERLFLDEYSSDVVLRTASGEELPAHRFILAMASPTFKALLFQEISNNTPRTTRAIDVDHDVALEMLHYIYLGEIDAECELDLIPKIFQTAERYQMEGLRNECEKKLIDALRPDNVMDILKWADTHNVTHLKEAAVDRIFSQLIGPKSVDEKCDMLLGKHVPNLL